MPSFTSVLWYLFIAYGVPMLLCAGSKRPRFMTYAFSMQGLMFFIWMLNQ
jgi:hypothetical protein